jgi:hypothetical protein|tara:strand:- start:344 stop:760 length:417 start_codon:yes stop_codon:yes gene_type:complete
MNNLNPIDSLIYTMTLSAAVSGDITDKELNVIKYLFTTLPVFENSNNDHLSKKMLESLEVIKSEPNIENITDLISESLENNSNLKKTAYIIAIEIMMADLEVTEESHRVLELLENSFGLDTLETSSIKHTMKFKYQDL